MRGMGGAGAGSAGGWMGTGCSTRCVILSVLRFAATSSPDSPAP